MSIDMQHLFVMYKGEGGKDSCSVMGMLGQLVGLQTSLRWWWVHLASLSSMPSYLVLITSHWPVFQLAILIAHVPIHPVYHSHHYLHPPFVAPRLSVVQFVNLQNQV